MSLCEQCEAIDLTEILAKSIPPDSKSIAPGWIHSETFARLRSSAETCELCSIMLVDAATNPLVLDDDCVYLFTFTRATWPRVGPGRDRPIPVGGFTVQIGPKGVNLLHSVRRIDVWIDEREAVPPMPVSCSISLMFHPRLSHRVEDAHLGPARSRRMGPKHLAALA